MINTSKREEVKVTCFYCSRWLMNSSDAYSRSRDVFEMKMAAALGLLKAEAMPSGDFGSAPLSDGIDAG